MLVDKANIEEFLPQKPPMVMVDAILEINETGVVTEFTPTESNIFAQNGNFSAPGLMENMAQTCAAKAGYEAAMKNESPVIGFIAAIKNLQIHRIPALGETLNTTMKATAQVMNFTIADIKIERNGEVLASCEMKIYLTEMKAEEI